MANTTARPWVADKYGQVNGPDGKVVTVWGLGIAHGQRTPEHEGNAHLIIRSVNAFESMKTALRLAKARLTLHLYEPGTLGAEVLAEINAALKLAEEKE